MCVSKVQHMTGRKTGCNRSRPVFFGFSIFRQTSQLAAEKIQNLCNRNRWSGLLQLGSVRFRSFFQSNELDLRTLTTITRQAFDSPSSGHFSTAQRRTIVTRKATITNHDRRCERYVVTDAQRLSCIPSYSVTPLVAATFIIILWHMPRVKYLITPT